MTPTPTILLRQRNTKKSLDFSGDQRTMDLVVREQQEKKVFNAYVGQIGEEFYEMLEEFYEYDLDMLEFLLGDGQ